MTSPHFDLLERIVRRDPAARGVAGFLHHGRPLNQGHLAAAAAQLASSLGSIAIVTGFVVVDQHDQPLAAETDGPPGALLLADLLIDLGARVALISDQYGADLLAAGCRHWALNPEIVRPIPLDRPAAEAWIADYLASPHGAALDHLIAVERVGPSHTRRSLLAQPRAGPAPLAQFEQLVPPHSRDVCHSMAGRPLDRWTAPAHLLFERCAARRPGPTTIGIGDGGNEIGMGAIPWELLCQAIARGPAPRVACRVPTDYTILAGVSNFGAYALAFAVAALCGRADLLVDQLVDRQARLIEHLVYQAGAVDGLTGRRQPTVDGLALPQYLATFTELLRAARP